jgi:hypothetical protein
MYDQNPDFMEKRGYLYVNLRYARARRRRSSLEKKVLYRKTSDADDMYQKWKL